MRRLFLALPIPLDVAEILSSHVPDDLGIRAVPAINFHLTLKFLGATEEKQIPEIEDALGALDVSRFEFTVRGCGVFPGGRSPKVLYFGVQGGPALGQLKRQVEACLVPLRIPKEPRPWVPHVTLARLDRAPDHVLAQFLATYHDFTGPVLKAQELVLYESRQTAGHPTYTPLSACRLGNLRDYLLED